MSILGLVGGLVGAGLSIRGAKRQNQMAAEIAERQMQFQREVMQNRYQWQVNDLRQAGLNPVLATGLSAGMASGASYQPENEYAGASAGIISAIGKALAVREQRNRDKLADAQASLLDAQRRDVEAKTSAEYWDRTSGRISAETQYSLAGASETRARAETVRRQLDIIPLKLKEYELNLKKSGAMIQSLHQQIRESKSRVVKNELEAKLSEARRQAEGFRSMVLEGQARLIALEEEGQELGLKVKRSEVKGALAPVNKWLREYGALDTSAILFGRKGGYYR